MLSDQGKKKSELCKDMKIVASARFNKSRRLEKRSWWSLFSISSLSLSLIILTVCENCFIVDSIKPLIGIEYTIPSWIFTTIVSMVILVLSIAISFAKFDVQYERVKDSALKINALARRAEVVDTDYKILLDEYLTVICDNDINHDSIDYFLSKSEINKNTTKTYHLKKIFHPIIECSSFYLIAFVSFSVDWYLLTEVIG